MTRSLRWGWALLPYLAVFAGMFLFGNAWGALIGFHLSLLPLACALRPARRGGFSSPFRFASCSPSRLPGWRADGGCGWSGRWPACRPIFPRRSKGLGLRCAAWPLFLAYFTLLSTRFWKNGAGAARWAAISPRRSRWMFFYAGYHVSILALFAAPGWVLIGFCCWRAAGWFWRQTARLTGSLLPAALSHLLADASILMIALYWKAC